MFMRSRLAVLSFVFIARLAWAQTDTHGSFKIDFPKDSPVSFVGADWGQSRPRRHAVAAYSSRVATARAPASAR